MGFFPITIGGLPIGRLPQGSRFPQGKGFDPGQIKFKTEQIWGMRMSRQGCTSFSQELIKRSIPGFIQRLIAASYRPSIAARSWSCPVARTPLERNHHSIFTVLPSIIPINGTVESDCRPWGCNVLQPRLLNNPK